MTLGVCEIHRSCTLTPTPPPQTAPPVDLKKGTSFYLSEKHPDKLVHEGIFTVFNEIDIVKSELNAMLRPNGSQQAPARSCYDLFLCNPKLKEGKLKRALSTTALLCGGHYHTRILCIF